MTGMETGSGTANGSTEMGNMGTGSMETDKMEMGNMGTWKCCPAIMK